MDASAPLGRVAAWGTALLLVAAPLAVGGTRWGVQLALAAVALVLLAAASWARLADGGLRVPWPLWGPIALVGLGLFQLLPLPPSVVAALSPQAHEVLEHGLADLGLYGPDAWRPLSLDPASTWVATFHQAAFAAVALVAANFGRRDGRLVERGLVLGAGLVALVGFAHWIFGLDRIYGGYDALDIARLTGWFSTFVNQNTAAGYLALGALVSLGLFAGTGDERTRRLAAATLTLSAAGCFLTGSRGGHAALAAGLVVFAALAHAPGADDGDDTRARARLTSRVALLIGAVGVGLAVLLLPDWHKTTWDDPGAEQKVTAWLATPRYLADYWGFGSGRGTFAVVYPHYQELQFKGTVSHPENIVLQLTTEWGVVGGAVALVSGVVGWVVAVGAVGRTAHPAHWGLVAGLGAVGLQQLVDFGFEASGLSLPVAAGLGLALGRAARKRSSRPRPRRPGLAWGAAVVALLLAGLLAWRGPAAVDDHPDAAVQAVRDAADDVDAILALAKRRVADHPADHLLPLAVAARLASTRAASLATVMRWVNRSLFLFPRGGEAHLLAARVLASAGRGDQAALEYRLALEAQPWRLLALLPEVVARFTAPALLLRAVPETPHARGALGDALLRGPGPERARATMRLAVEAAPHDVEAREALARACERLGDADCVEAEARALIAAGHSPIGQAMLAAVAAKRGDAEQARAAIAAGEAAGGRDVRFLHRAAHVYLAIGDADAARRTLDRLWPLVALDDRAAANALGLRGDVEARFGRPEQALKAYLQANERDPRPERARRAADHARAMGRAEEAERILEAATGGGVGRTPEGRR